MSNVKAIYETELVNLINRRSHLNNEYEKLKMDLFYINEEILIYKNCKELLINSDFDPDILMDDILDKKRYKRRVSEDKLELLESDLISIEFVLTRDVGSFYNLRYVLYGILEELCMSESVLSEYVGCDESKITSLLNEGFIEACYYNKICELFGLDKYSYLFYTDSN